MPAQKELKGETDSKNRGTRKGAMLDSRCSTGSSNKLKQRDKKNVALPSIAKSRAGSDCVTNQQSRTCRHLTEHRGGD